MSILVTGATGFVGSRLVARLVQDGNQVRILRRRDSRLDLLDGLANEVEHFIGDITDRDSLEGAFTGVDYIYHAAASVGDDERSGPAELQRVNVHGTFNVVNAALFAGVSRLVLTSSMAAFGRGFDHNDPIDETADWEASSNNSSYARSKHEAELEVHRGIGEGLDAVIVNPSLIFGVGRSDQNTRRIIESIRHRRVPAVPSGATNVVDVEDVVEGHVRAMASGVVGQRYFLGSENLTWKQIIGTIANAFDVRAPKRVVSPRAAHAIAIVSELVGLLPGVRTLITRERARYTSSVYRYDNAKACRELGMTFRPFDETVRRIAAAIDPKSDRAA